MVTRYKIHNAILETNIGQKSGVIALWSAIPTKQENVMLTKLLIFLFNTQNSEGSIAMKGFFIKNQMRIEDRTKDKLHIWVSTQIHIYS